MEPTPQQIALFVPAFDDNFYPDRVPQTGEEYLQQVIYERRMRVPEVVSNHRNKPPAKPTSWDKLTETDLQNHAPHHVMPTKEWTDIQMDQFQKLQEKILSLKQDDDRYQSGGLSSEVINDWKTFCQTNPPLLKTVLSLSQLQWEDLLESQLEWLSSEKELKLHSDHLWMGQWIYACLASLMTPVEPNVHHLIRQIARSCIRRRNELKCAMEVSPLNVLICIVSVYFKQSDLCV